MFSRRALIGTAAIAVAGATGAVLWKARANKAQVFTGILPGVAIGGYDAVAYFTEGIPTPGREDISLQHDGATWRFSSDEHRRTFRADPSRYAPRYGGYCAYAVAGGGTSGASPKAWRLVEGRLYLNATPRVQLNWEKDIPGYIRKADANWPKVLSQ